MRWLIVKGTNMPSVRLIAASLVTATLFLAACNASKPAPVVTAPVAVAPEPPAPGVVGTAVGRDLDERTRLSQSPRKARR